MANSVGLSDKLCLRVSRLLGKTYYSLLKEAPELRRSPSKLSRDPLRVMVVEAFLRLSAFSSALCAHRRARAFEKFIPLLLQADSASPLQHAAQLDIDGGVSSTMRARVDEVLRTGTLTEIYKAYEDPNWDSLLQITSIPFFSFKTALRLQKIYGIRTLEELRDADYDILGLTERQRSLAACLPHVANKVSYEECAQHEITIKTIVDKHLGAGVADVQVAGSYRRGLPFTRQPTVIISPTSPGDGVEQVVTDLRSRVTEALMIEGYMLSLLKTNERKNNVLCIGHVPLQSIPRCGKALHAKEPSTPMDPAEVRPRVVDMRFTRDVSQSIASFFIETGPPVYVARARLQAAQNGMWLSHDGLFDIRNTTEREAEKLDETAMQYQPIKVTSEQELCEKIGFDYLRPDLRYA